MASGGRDGYDTDDELDLEEIKYELNALHRTTDSDQTDSTSQTEPAVIVNGIGLDFQGFQPDLSAATRYQQALQVLTTARDGVTSAPTSPTRVASGFVQRRVLSYGALDTISQAGSLPSLRSQASSQADHSPSLAQQATSQAGSLPALAKQATHQAGSLPALAQQASSQSSGSPPLAPQASRQGSSSSLPYTRASRPSILASRQALQVVQPLRAASISQSRHTRQAAHRGLCSPPQVPQNHSRRSRQRRRIVPVVTEQIVTMAQADIPEAGRLNPRNRRAGGVGDTVENLHFPVLATENIPPAGKNVLRIFAPLRARVVANVNLVLSETSNWATCKATLNTYITNVTDCRDKFCTVLATVVDEIPNVEAAINEIITFHGELEGLLIYCNTQLVTRPAHAPVAAEGIKLERLCFPHFDGVINFRAFKTEFQGIANRRVPDNEERKTYLKKSLQGKALDYISQYMTPRTTYQEMWDMLEQRYDDPMANNYAMLNRAFNTPQFNKSKSTQSHWDNAVGDIREVMESGLAVDEILVYYRLHRFPPDVVRRVKDMHRITYPARNSINLVEAMAIFNKITAEEPALTEDSVSIEQSIKNFTFTATPIQTHQLSTVTPPKQSQPNNPSPSGKSYSPPSQNRGGGCSGRGRVCCRCGSA